MSDDPLLDVILSSDINVARLGIGTGNEEQRILGDTINKYSDETPSTNQINNQTQVSKSFSSGYKQKKHFNILEDYIWTLSENKKIIIENVPKLIATEYNIDTSPLIQNLKASYTVGKEAMTRSSTMGLNAVSDIANAVGLGGNFQAITAPEWANTYITQAGEAASVVGDIFKKITSNTGILQENEMAWNNTNLKKLYNHLYTLKQTGNQFTFPYLDNNFFNITNQFSTGNEYLQFDIGLFSKDFGDISNTIKKLSNIPALLSPGAYIQTPQFYDFGGLGEPSVTIIFPLYNIVDSPNTVKNIEFVKLFGLNNMPYRRDLIAVDPTKIYDIYIPGKANFPLCFVSNYKVNHLGVKNFHFDDIYPEAYTIEITFKSLIKYDVNMYIEAMNAGRIYTPPPGRSVQTENKVTESVNDNTKNDSQNESKNKSGSRTSVEQEPLRKDAMMGQGGYDPSFIGPSSYEYKRYINR